MQIFYKGVHKIVIDEKGIQHLSGNYEYHCKLGYLQWRQKNKVALRARKMRVQVNFTVH